MSRYTIRVKNKHLIIAIMLVLSVVGLVRASGDEYLFKMAEEARRNNSPAKAIAYYDRYISEYPNNEDVPVALYWSALLLPDGKDFLAVIFPSHSTVRHSDGAVQDMPRGILTRQERLQRILADYPDSWAAPHALRELAEAFYHSGDPRAEEFLLKAAMEGKGGGDIDAALNLVNMYVAEGRFSEAIDLLDYCAREMPTFLAEQREIMRGDVLAALGNYEAAKAAYEEALNAFERGADYWAKQSAQGRDIGPSPDDVRSTRSFYHDQVDVKLASLKALVDAGDAAKGLGTVEGVVLLAGRPLEGVKVLVNEVNDSSRFSSDMRGMPWKSTGNSGEFDFELPSGRRYEVGIALNDEAARKVEGYHLQMLGAELTLGAGETKRVQLRFVEPVIVIQPAQGFVYGGQPFSVKWQAYPGAEAYAVSFRFITFDEHGHGSIGTGGVATSDTGVELDRIPAPAFGAYGGDQRGILPAYLTGKADAYSLHIDALDGKGNVISSSGGLYFGTSPNEVNLIQVKGYDPSEAEKLLIDRKYDEAVAVLEERIARHPYDVEALEILGRVYFMGTYYLEQDHRDDNMAHKDLKRSRDMFQRLVTLEPSRERLEALATVCRSLKDWENAVEAYREILDQGFEADSTVYSALAYDALTVGNDLKKAFAYLEQGKGSVDQPYAAAPFAGMYLLTGQCGKAIELLQSVGPLARTDSGSGLEQNLRDYVEWSAGRRSDYLGTVSSSFEEARKTWLKDSGAHGAFLLLIADLSDPWRHLQRTEIMKARDEFRAKFGKTAPVLQSTLDSFAGMAGF